MTFRGALLAGTAALLMSSASAFAADLGGMKGGSIKDGGYVQAEPHARLGGLYLRGDFGWASQDIGSMYEPPAYELSNKSISSTTMWGAGIGYYFSRNVRGDLTLDWRNNADVRGSVTDGLATVQGERQFGVKNLVGLMNVYYDFDLRSHFTPYIGVGLGFARNTTSSGSVAISGCDALDALGQPACQADFEGATKWNAAGALMAGFSAKLHDRLHLDAGYRFLYLGDSHTGDIRITRAVGSTVTGPGPTSTPDPFVYDQHAHEVRVGLRWDIK